MLGPIGRIVAAFFAGLLGRHTQPRKAAARSDEPATFAIAGHLRGTGTFDCEVVGESHYQDNIAHVAGGRTREGVSIRTKATLYLDNKNRHDRQAVRVLIDGYTVGHLSRSEARDWRKFLKSRNQMAHFTADALIVGGWDRSPQDRGHFGVRLDIPFGD